MLEPFQPIKKEKVSYTERTEQRFMQCAERFSNRTSMSDLNPTKMIALLALPESETQAFIEQKAAEGKPVEDMTVKTLRQEVKEWKEKAETAERERDEAKKQVPHEEWGKWLEEKVNFSQDTATNFMNIATEYSNSETYRNLNLSQMTELFSITL